MNNLVFSNTYFSKIIFRIYDRILLKYAMPIIWKCKVSEIENLYNRHLSQKHLDIGAGTGYFIKKSNRLENNTKITIMDINPVCLNICKEQLKEYSINIYEHDILKPIPDTEKFDSIALNLLLHCLPGDMISKQSIFLDAKNRLNRKGTIFGTTFILNKAKLNILTWIWFRIFNITGLLNNRKDRLADLENILENNFQHYTIQAIGHCILFSARI